MPIIRQLPPSVINKIAAGEVIERPASVVKELLENSVDAAATRIDVSVEQGGSELVRIADNGCGIDGGQLSLAVASHATSKIQDADDLFRVHSLGFRGEALASIAEVSHMVLRSRPAEADAGQELEINGGKQGDIAPCGCPVGTTIEVRNLFFNTPVRRKFLRTTQTEMGHATEAFTRIALAHPHVHFTLRHNSRVLHDLPPAQNWRERIATFFGGEIAESLIWVESEDEANGATISGFVANPTQSRGNNRMQYLFLNGRFIRDRSLQHALGEAYRGLLMTGRFPIVFLRLEIPAETVDVNVHPTKLEVRFQDSGRLYSQLLKTLRSKFLSTDLTAKVADSAGDRGSETDAVTGPAPVARDETALDPAAVEQHRRDVTSWAKGDAAESPQVAPAPQQQTIPMHRLTGGVPEFQPFDTGRGSPATVAMDQPAAATSAPSVPVLEEQDAPAASSTGLQVHNRYLITENDEGMVVVDQHALHERVLYEQLREKVTAGKLETQRLLVPEPVSLTAAEAGAALDVRDTLASLGIEIEAFGGDTVLISAYPAMLANMSPAEVLRQILDLLMSGEKQPERRDVLDELLHMISCKAAIKAGDRLAPEEVDALLEQRHLFADTHHCPHGRPTALVFTREELDKRFKRT